MKAAGGTLPAESFAQALERRGLVLRRGRTEDLQVNLGLVCNQRCAHCRLSAGPDRTEVMSWKTMEQVAVYAARCGFRTVDITGGAPELHPRLPDFIRLVAPRAGGLRLRTNLTALLPRADRFLPLLAEHRMALAASLPSLEEAVAESQRGKGTFRTSLECLRLLNARGWGVEGSGLVLELVTNPVGPSLPKPQAELERDFRRTLRETWGVTFNKLYSFTNIPLERFGEALAGSGALDGYLDLLRKAFNLEAVAGLMCRTAVSVDWDGFLYDCDFNIPTGLYLGGVRRHVSEMAGPPEPGSPIALGDHCFACTAGSGFT